MNKCDNTKDDPRCDLVKKNTPRDRCGSSYADVE